MCARYTLTAEEKQVLKENPYQLADAYEPDSNIAVTNPGYVVTSDEPALIQKMHFGIVPHDAETNTLTYDTWNIRSEEVMEKKTYRPLMKFRKTCLVVMDSFYEWQTVNGQKLPYRFTVPGRKTFCCAGLWSRWVDPITGEEYDTFGIMTCKANDLVGEIHEKKRMPVILHKTDERLWLNKKASLEELIALCVPFPDKLMDRYRVSQKVNRVSTKKIPNKGIELTLPLNTDEEPAAPIPPKIAEPKKASPKAPKKPDQSQGPDLFS
jgi:putative SOS response-associated peptidase YedK